MTIDDYCATGIEIIKDETVPYGCIRIYYEAVDEFENEKSGYIDLIISQSEDISKISREAFILVENEDEESKVDYDIVQQLLNSLADKFI